MTVLLAVAGLAMVAFVVYDAVTTTMSPTGGGGPLTRSLVAVTRGLPRPTPVRRLVAPGVGLLVITVISWTALLWAGWTLVLGASEGTIKSSTTGLPADLGERLYYAGFTVVTLGTGDYVPVGTWPQVATVVAAFSGLFVVTLAITYLLSAVGAVVEQRTLATTVTLLGDGAQDIVQGWHRRPDGAASLDEQLGQLAPQVVRLSQLHLAYPVLHRFADTDPRRSAPVALALLHDMLQLLDDLRGPGTAPPEEPAPGESMLARALDVYVHALAGPASDGPASDGSAPDDQARTGRDGDRRGRLEFLLQAAGQSWPAPGTPDSR